MVDRILKIATRFSADLAMLNPLTGIKHGGTPCVSRRTKARGIIFLLLRNCPLSRLVLLQPVVFHMYKPMNRETRFTPPAARPRAPRQVKFIPSARRLALTSRMLPPNVPREKYLVESSGERSTTFVVSRDFSPGTRVGTVTVSRGEFALRDDALDVSP